MSTFNHHCILPTLLISSWVGLIINDQHIIVANPIIVHFIHQLLALLPSYYIIIGHSVYGHEYVLIIFLVHVYSEIQYFMFFCQLPIVVDALMQLYQIYILLFITSITITTICSTVHILVDLHFY